MAEKEISNVIKLQIEAGKATPAPPVGPALGSSGVNIMQFVKEFNDRTANQPGMIIPVVITVYKDKSFETVKKAMLVMLDGCTNLRVARKPKLEMKVEKNGISLNVSQLSDGEKCTMALFGDLARRLSIANPCLDNPLLGEGVVLIDEIELHMHPSWQRGVLKKLRKTFPNIQFIITTHSPIVLSEVDNEYNIYFMRNLGKAGEIVEFKRLDGFDANYILEEFMGTKSINSKTEQLINDIYRLINNKSFDEAENKVKELENLTDSVNKDVLRANILIRKGRLS